MSTIARSERRDDLATGKMQAAIFGAPDGNVLKERPTPEYGPTSRRSSAAAPSELVPFELLEWKFLPPRRRGGLVSRTELVARLESARSLPVAMLCAGPGWGKTTLLAQWAELSTRPFAWVTVDERDNDPIVLLTYVAVALDRIEPLDCGVFDALADPGVSVETTVVPRLGEALATMAQAVVLVLDDLHLLDNRACSDAIAMLARYVPQGSQLALSERGGGIGLAARRVQHLGVEIGPEDLRLDDAAAGRLLGAEGLDLPAERVGALVEQTEGWPAGLYFAALSIRARDDTNPASAGFSGSDRVMADYMRWELSAYVSAEEFRFLTRTAVLERMSGELCDAVLDADGSGAALEWLERANLFVVALDADGAWYRYNHLFQELLRFELERVEPALVPSLLARASAWCEANGQLETAIGYAIQAGDVQRAARLVERSALSVYRSGRVATVERWLDWLEAHGALEHNPAVAVLAGLVAMLSGRPAKADRLAELAERASRNGVSPESHAARYLPVLRALRCPSGVARMRADAELAVETLEPGSPLRPAASLALGISRWLAGEIDHADDLLADAAEEGLEEGAPETAVVALGERAAIAIGRGAWVEAEELADRALRLLGRSRTSERPTSALVYALAARVALHRGRGARAHELLTRAQRLRPHLTYALPHVAIQTRVELARAYVAVPDAGGARTMLREIDALQRRRPDMGYLTTCVEELRASLTTMRADPPAASALSAAELRIMPYLGTHLSFREIGERQHVSQHTVKSHAKAIYRKLSVTSRGDAVERGRQLGLV
jgi:LuxR family maltose regulon positive regulatory protein